MNPFPKAAAAWVFTFVIILVSGCGARTGLRVPDTRPFAPPLCSSTTNTLVVSLTPDPIVPTSHINSLTRVVWDIYRKCATDIPSDPSQGIGGRQGRGCTITQYVGRNSSPEFGGDCIGPPGGPDPADWHVTGTTNTPGNMSFTFFGNIQGNVCVSGTAFFSNGLSVEIPQRMWRVQLDGGVLIPPIGYWLRSTPTDPTAVPASSSAVGCPGN